MNGWKHRCITHSHFKPNLEIEFHLFSSSLHSVAKHNCSYMPRLWPCSHKQRRHSWSKMYISTRNHLGKCLKTSKIKHWVFRNGLLCWRDKICYRVSWEANGGSSCRYNTSKLFPFPEHYRKKQKTWMFNFPCSVLQVFIFILFLIIIFYSNQRKNVILWLYFLFLAFLLSSIMTKNVFSVSWPIIEG